MDHFPFTFNFATTPFLHFYVKLDERNFKTKRKEEKKSRNSSKIVTTIMKICFKEYSQICANGHL